MLTEEDIASMFEEMGLGSEEERARFTRMATPPNTDIDKEQIFIRSTTTTNKEEGSEDAELA